MKSSAKRVAVLAVLAVVTIWTAFWLRTSPQPLRSAKPSKPVLDRTVKWVAPPASASGPMASPAAPTDPVEPPASAGDPVPACKTRMLQNEPLLRRAGITLSMGHSVGKVDLRFPYLCQLPQQHSFFALTSRGMEPLSVDPAPAEVSVSWACGRRDPAFRMIAGQPLERGNIPVAITAHSAESLQWVPAMVIEGSVDCPPPPGRSERQRQTLFEFPGAGGRWSIDRWFLYIATGADPSAINQVVTLNRVSPQGSCEVQDRVESSDLGPRRPNQGEYQRIHGWLTVKDDIEEKSWMIFAAGGGESDGVAMVPFDPETRQLQPQQVQFQRYDGC